MPETMDRREMIIHAAMTCAGEKGWENTTLPDIAAAAKLSLAELHDVFMDKSDILYGFGRMIDRQVLGDHSAGGETDSCRDLLFDLIMDRFEALNDFRAGILSVLDTIKFDPKQTIFAAPHLCRSMSWMLEASGISTTGLKGAARVAGLTAIYLKTARIWAEDESVDLAKTMAALDKDLAKAEDWAGRFGF